MSVCAGCGIAIPPSRGGPPRKWCSEQCRKRTLYSGTCVGCGALTYGGDGRGNAPDRCAACYAIDRKKWTREAIIAAIQRWASEHGRTPTSIDWNATMARESGRPQRGSDYPNTVTVQNEFGSWNAGIEAAGFPARGSGDQVYRSAAA